MPRSPKAREIVDITRKLLVKGGYHAFSFADIAAEVHISKASIHHHFPTKEILVASVVADYRAEALAGMAAVSASSADMRAALHAYVAFWAQCIASAAPPICICAMLAGELPGLPPTVAAEVSGHFADLRQWLTAQIEQGQQAGAVALHRNAALEAELLMASVHGAMLAARALADPALFKTIAESALARLIATA